MNYEICQVPTYKVKYELTKKSVKPIEIINAILINDLQLHERLGENDLLKLSVDVDKLTQKNNNAKLEKVFENICEYVGITFEDISYTTNFYVTSGSHHIVIPKYYMGSNKQKEYWKNFREKYGYGKEIDADIFGKNGWFRLPNQTKEGLEGTEHIIQKGKIQDFVLKYIEESTEKKYIKNELILKPLIAVKENEGVTDEEISQITENSKNDFNSNIKIETIKFLLNECIRDSLCNDGKQNEWCKVAQVIKNELGNEGYDLFYDWTKQFGTENKKKEAFEIYSKYIKITSLKTKNRITLGSLHYWAKENNYETYISRFQQKSYEKDIDIETVIEQDTEYSIAVHFNKLYGDKYKYIDGKKSYYKFNENKLWEEETTSASIRNLLSLEYKDIFEAYSDIISKDIKEDSDESENNYLKKKIKTIYEITRRLQKTVDKNNILREFQDLIINSRFCDDMNKQKNMLPIKNKKILNLITLQTVERRMEHKFDYECDANYIKLSLEEENDINQYFLDLFCNDQLMVDCIINIFKSIFSGNKLRYIFFFTGSGMNGKSLLFSILNKIFKTSMNTISKNVILDLKQNNSITTEFEKLDKCRLGYITELKETDKLNETVIKQISGGDAIDLRALYKTNTTIEPTSNLCVLTNKLPSFEKEKAIVDRIIVIPFKNTFEIDSSFEAKMLAKKDLVFSYIMQKGNILDKFDLTEEMIEAKNQYIEANENVDYLQDFISQNYNIVPFIKKEKIRNDDFVSMYNCYIQKNKIIDKNNSIKKITRRLKLYNINSKESNGKSYYLGLIAKVDEECESDDE